MRSRKLKHVEKEFDWSSPLVEPDPVACRGQWAQRFLPAAREVRLDLGCGKGSFTILSAQAEPDVLFVGMDCERGCIARAAQRAGEAGVANAIFAVGDADDMLRYFAEGELDVVHLNFSTPFTPAKQAPKRLTHLGHLMDYRAVLKPAGTLRFKTDSAPLFDYSLTQFDLAGYTLLWSTRDLHATGPAEVRSDYEELLTAKGATIHALCAQPGSLPARLEPLARELAQIAASVPQDAQTVCERRGRWGERDRADEVARRSALERAEGDIPQGLASYLPEDLDSLTYIPYGMESTVENYKNRRANLARASRASRTSRRRS